jgi:hypothetical protein
MSDSRGDDLLEARSQLKRFMIEICKLLKRLAKEPNVLPKDDIFTGPELDKQIEAAFNELQIDEPNNASTLHRINNGIGKLTRTSLQSVGLFGANLKVKLSAFYRYRDYFIILLPIWVPKARRFSRG